jgi:hypothetical protein
MKTPSFGNNSGPDDQYAIFKSTERREQDMEYSLNTKMVNGKEIVKEVEFDKFSKKEKFPVLKSVPIDDVVPVTQDQNIMKYANTMGHKKQQHVKKPSNSGKSSVAQYFKPRVTYKPYTEEVIRAKNSRTFIDNHNFEPIDENVAK